MKKIRQILSEASTAKANKKDALGHPEDYFLDDGKEGYEHAKDVLAQVFTILTGGKSSARLRVKSEGTPIVAGYDPISNRFFVASKAIFNKLPKVNFSKKEIEENHQNDPELVEKLINAFKHLPKVIHHGIHGGDYVYDESSKKSDGVETHFKGKKQTASVMDASEEGDKIKKAKIGVAFHTSYSGADLASLKPNHGKKANFSEHPDVHIIQLDHDPETGLDQFTDGKKRQYEMNLKVAEKYGRKNIWAIIQPHGGLIKEYIRSSIKEGDKRNVLGYKKFLQKQKISNKENLIKHVEDNNDAFDAAFRLHKHLEAAKNALVTSLSPTHGDYRYSDNKGKPTRPEGRIAVVGNRPSKLQDRRVLKEEYEKYYDYNFDIGSNTRQIISKVIKKVKE